MNRPGRLLFRSFLMIFLALWIPMTAIMTAYGVNGIREDRARYDEQCRADAAAYVDKLHDRLASLTSSANGVFYSRWYEHFINSADVYRDEFDVLKKTEISYQLKLLIYSMDFASDVLVISPDHDTIITTQGWYSIRDFNRYYFWQSMRMAAVELTDGTVTVTPEPGWRRLLLPDVTKRLHRAYVCILLDEAKLTAWARSELPETLYDAQIRVDGQIAVEPRDPAAPLGLTQVRYELPQTEAAFAKVPWARERQAIRLTALALQLLVMTVLLVLAVWAVTWFLYRPVKTLLRRLPRDESRTLNEAMGRIGELVDAVADRNVQLSDENSSLKRTIDDYVARSENELLLSLLLTRPEMNGGSRRTVPADWEEGRYILALLGFEGDPSRLPRLSPPGCREVRVLHILSHEYALIGWLDADASETELPAQVCAYFDRILPRDCDYLCSDAFQGIRNLYTEYEALQRTLQLHGEAERMLPNALQLSLLAHIKAGRFESAVALIEAEKEHWEPSHFFVFLLHAAYEAGMDTTQIRRIYRRSAGNTANLWNTVIELTGQLCQQAVSGRRRSADNVAGLMRAYIDENYADPELSVKLLAERFHMDSTQVSKIFKAQMDTTFSDYLLEKRIGMALSLMSDPSMSLLSIAEAVGYSNYLTFKRAFVRLRGMSPRDYRQLFGDTADEPEPKVDAN